MSPGKPADLARDEPETNAPELNAISLLLRNLPPIEPPPATLARTHAALDRLRNRRAARWAGRLGLVAAGALATVGLTVLGRSLDQRAQEKPFASLSGPPAGPSSASESTGSTVDLGPTAGNTRGRYALGDDDHRGESKGDRTGKLGGELDDEQAGQDVHGGVVDDWMATSQRQQIVVAQPGFEARVVLLDGDGQTDPATSLDTGTIVDGSYQIALATDGKDANDVTRGARHEGSKGVAPDEPAQLAQGGKQEPAHGYWYRPAAPEPEPDRDGDAIRDVEDRCPDNGETKNGRDDGCPDPATGEGRIVKSETRPSRPTIVLGLVDPTDQRNRETRHQSEETLSWDQTVARVSGLEPNGQPAPAAVTATTEEVGANRPSDASEASAPVFIPASGYFANTYLPGDPEVAWLRQEVARGFYRDGQRVPLDELATAVKQPFDAPRDQAVAVQVTADRAAVSGPTRMTLQVGLAAAAQAPARRAPLAVTLVVDLGSIAGDADRRLLWSIADAFTAARQPGDRMSLVVPGAGGPTALSDDALTGAEVMRFLAEALEKRGTGAGAGELAAALEQGYAEVRRGASGGGQGDAQPAELGASVVVLATAGTPVDVPGLVSRAHDQALGGIQLAVIGAGDRAAGGVLAELASAGQGRRWLVTRPEDARRAVAQELGASGRAVARALRLQLRLAPGVKLVAVLGSHALDAPESERVRRAERAIDLKVAETTGIRADRGADEDGIQIVIPAFMAGDDHVILLDVVVPGPGPVLDVHARFKDLLRMQNGEAQASLTLESGRAVMTPLALNVVENRAAFDTAQALRGAAALVAAGDANGAVQRIAATKKALESFAGVAQATSLAGDMQLLGAYAGLLLDAGWLSDPALARHVTRSLQLAAAIRGGAH